MWQSLVLLWECSKVCTFQAEGAFLLARQMKMGTSICGIWPLALGSPALSLQHPGQNWLSGHLLLLSMSLD